MSYRLYLSVTATLALAATSHAQPAPTPAEQPGKQLFLDTCGGCHTLDIATAHRMTGEEWRDTVDRMIMMGAELSPESSALIVDYLTKQHGLDEPGGGATSTAGSPPQ